MKKLPILLFFCLALLTIANAQTPPNAFNYSAVARNAAGQPIVTSTIGIQISILKTSTTGASQYSENHFVNTDAFGLFNLVIGAGAVQSGSMASIDWSNDNYYLKVSMDASGGTNFLTMGTTQLLSVPYAMYAKSAGSVSGGSGITISSISSDGDTLYLSNGQAFVAGGNSANQEFNFYLNFPNTINVTVMDSISSIIELNWIDGIPDLITLSVSSPPSNLTAFITNNTFIPPANISSQPKLHLVSSGQTCGSYPMTLTATSTNGITKSINFIVNIVTPALTGVYNNFVTYSDCSGSLAGSELQNISTSLITITNASTQMSINNFNGYGSDFTAFANLSCGLASMPNQTINNILQTVGNISFNGLGNFTITGVDTDIVGGGSCNYISTYVKISN
jgi:hypothetical protein